MATFMRECNKQALVIPRQVEVVWKNMWIKTTQMGKSSVYSFNVSSIIMPKAGTGLRAPIGMNFKASSKLLERILRIILSVSTSKKKPECFLEKPVSKKISGLLGRK